MQLSRHVVPTAQYGPYAGCPIMLDRGLQALWLGGHPRLDRMGRPASRKRLATVCASIPYWAAMAARESPDA
jgi:hypothetical protein